MKNLLIVFLFLISSAEAKTATISKKEFMDFMKTVLPNSLCKKQQYFRQCFNVTEDECIEEAIRSTKVCLKSLENEIPLKLNQPEDGGKWGTKIGECTGTGYETSLIKKKLTLEKCKNPANWK